MKQVKSGPGRAANHSVVVGHSFGGLILEYAIQEQMEKIGQQVHDELAKEVDAENIQIPALANFADLVVLINQAAPADHAVTLLSQYRTDLQQVRLRWPAKKTGCPPSDTSPDCRESTHPLLLSISSSADLATKAVLPIAETISPPKDRPRVLPPGTLLPPGLDIKKVFTTAAAHTPQLYSHTLLTCGPGQDCAPCGPASSATPAGDAASDNIPVAITLPAYAPGNTRNIPEKINYCLVPDPEAWNRTPYWIFEIPPEVVPDHSTIFTDRFIEFLRVFMPPLELLNPATPVPAVKRVTLTREARRERGVR
jgi:hypothetical protein